MYQSIDRYAASIVSCTTAAGCITVTGARTAVGSTVDMIMAGDWGGILFLATG